MPKRRLTKKPALFFCASFFAGDSMEKYEKILYGFAFCGAFPYTIKP